MGRERKRRREERGRGWIRRGKSDECFVCIVHMLLVYTRMSNISSSSEGW